MNNTWRFDPAYTTVDFTIRNLWFNVKGRFKELDGALVLDGNDVCRSSVRATIKARSIDTGNKRRDAHLLSSDFFDADKYPDIHFESTRVQRGKDRDSLILDGTLMIKDKRVPVVLAVNEMDRSRSPTGEEFVYYSATTELDRHAFGMNYAPVLIARGLKVTINVQARTDPMRGDSN
ncbi:MAG TPA: YceI family protein [Pyrinomonadaceae bacterium]|nr:YceI family protein [Pyrinomonadaceae bacterium]